MAFMIPVAEWLTADEAAEYIGNDSHDASEPAPAGWYGRLSAPGYMDCSEWIGPFESADAAIAYVCELYEVDENGDEQEAE